MFFHLSFCFLVLADAESVSSAVALSGKDFKGSTLSIEVARPRNAGKQQQDKFGGSGGRGGNFQQRGMEKRELIHLDLVAIHFKRHKLLSLIKGQFVLVKFAT